MPSQIAQEVIGVIEFVDKVMKLLTSTILWRFLPTR